MLINYASKVDMENTVTATSVLHLCKVKICAVCDTYTRRLVFGEHTPGVIVKVVFIGGMLRLSKAVDKL